MILYVVTSADSNGDFGVVEGVFHLHEEAMIYAEQLSFQCDCDIEVDQWETNRWILSDRITNAKNVSRPQTSVHQGGI